MRLVKLERNVGGIQRRSLAAAAKERTKNNFTIKLLSLWERVG